MRTEKYIRIVSKYSSKLLDIYYQSDKFTDDDIEGMLMAQVMKLIKEVREEERGNDKNQGRF